MVNRSLVLIRPGSSNDAKVMPTLAILGRLKDITFAQFGRYGYIHANVHVSSKELYPTHRKQKLT